MDMDHGHHGHGDMDMGGNQCSMNMLFTWSTENLCIVFSTWRVTGPLSLLGSLVVIVLLAAGYEGIRQVTRKYEVAHARRLSAFSAAVVGSKSLSLFPCIHIWCYMFYIRVMCICRWVWTSGPSVYVCLVEGPLTLTPGLEGNEIADEAVTGSGPGHEAQSQAYVPNASSPLLVGSDNRRAVERRGKITMAALYGVQVFYSFFIMLLFMTYNGFVMLAVAVGAFVGYLAFGENMCATKSVACH
ncbi:Ctr copper transporter family-domain-containing protein [Aspergillus similis]